MFELSINLAAVLVAAAAATVFSAAWYSQRLLGVAWLKEVGKSSAEIKKKMHTKLAAAFATVLITSGVLDVFIRSVGANTIVQGMLVGLVAWFGFRLSRHWIATVFGTSSAKHFLLNSFHDLIQFLILGAVLGFMG